MQGHARFQCDDISAKLVKNIHDLVPADFHLAKRSPSQGVLSNGADLGAEVYLVGPGVAFERWKKTPQYQEWLKKTAAMLRP